MPCSFWVGVGVDVWVVAGWWLVKVGGREREREKRERERERGWVNAK